MNRMKSLAIISCVVSAGLALGMAVSRAPAKEPRGVLALVVEIHGGKPVLKSATLKKVGLQKRRGSRRQTSFRVIGFDSTGTAVFTRYLEDPALVRAEFHGRGPGEPIQGRVLRRKGPVVFSVRVPADVVTKIAVERLREGATADEAKKASAWLRLGTIDLPKGAGR
ncbi:MAG: hypothetical protein D6806_03955 [Deltaproteobacteria bacterium]|nr:MAG: hypothetical protein D6806_03955 [Deltaproteobacteria bacterium]